MASFPDAEGVLVAVSGGKDSLATLDLCCRRFSRVVVWHMYFLPGLDCTDALAAYVRERWGLALETSLHWNTPYYLNRGVFCEPRDLPELTIREAEHEIRQRTGLHWIGYGYRAGEGLVRRAMLATWPNGLQWARGVFAPLVDWSARDVRRHLARETIRVPQTCHAWNLSPTTLAWVRATWPSDYRRILKVFPYAEAQADRAAVIRAERLSALRVSRDSARRAEERDLQPATD